MRLRHLLTLAALPLAAGCISLAPDPPDALLTLEARTPMATGTDTIGTAASAIFVAEPEVSARLSVTRVPVQVTDTEVAYLQDAVWVERPARLVRRLLAETLRARTRRLVVDTTDSALVPAETLRGTLHAFGYDARAQAVVMRFDAVRSAGDGEGPQPPVRGAGRRRPARGGAGRRGAEHGGERRGGAGGGLDGVRVSHGDFRHWRAAHDCQIVLHRTGCDRTGHARTRSTADGSGASKSSSPRELPLR